MNTLNRSSQIFMKLLAFNGSVLFAMSLQRLVLFLVVVRHWLFGADGMTIASSFFAGLRFDLCVLGFINIPVLFVVWLISTDFMTETSHPVLRFFRRWVLWIYLGISTFVIHAIGMLDTVYFASHGGRWTYYDWQESGLGFFSQFAQKWGALFTIGIVLVFLILWVFRCLFYLYRIQIHTVPAGASKFSRTKTGMVFFGIILPVLVTASAARGTWTAHHINREHARVSQNQVLNQMALSPLWAFDKKF